MSANRSHNVNASMRHKGTNVCKSYLFDSNACPLLFLDVAHEVFTLKIEVEYHLYLRENVSSK